MSAAEQSCCFYVGSVNLRRFSTTYLELKSHAKMFYFDHLVFSLFHRMGIMSKVLKKILSMTGQVEGAIVFLQVHLSLNRIPIQLAKHCKVHSCIQNEHADTRRYMLIYCKHDMFSNSGGS